MKIKVIMLILLISLLLMTFGGLSCDRKFRDETTMTTTEAQEGQILNVKVALGLNSSLTQGVTFDDVKVRVGTLKQTLTYPGSIDSTQKTFTGNRCILVLWDINNNTDQNLIISGSAIGYNSDWEDVSRCLTSARLEGIFDYSTPQHSVTSVNITMNWAEDVRFIELSVISSNEAEYYYHPSSDIEPAQITPTTISPVNTP